MLHFLKEGTLLELIPPLVGYGQSWQKECRIVFNEAARIPRACSEISGVSHQGMAWM